MNSPEAGMTVPEGGHPRFTVTLPADVIAELDAIAASRGHKRAAVIREAVLDWLQRFHEQRRGAA